MNAKSIKLPYEVKMCKSIDLACFGIEAGGKLKTLISYSRNYCFFLNCNFIESFIFQQSLGGNSKTTMIICCSPAKMNEGETQSTLLFGTRVKTIKNNVTANVEKSPDEWKRLYNSQMAKAHIIFFK